MKKWGRFVSILLLGCSLYSCGSYRQISRDEKPTLSGSQKKYSTSQASRILGIKITGKDNKRLMSEAASWMGTPYRYGGNTKNGTDCSGLTSQIYTNVYRINIVHNSQQQYNNADKKVKRRNLKQGDLVFFSPKKSKKKINHVGIYLKDGQFIHTSSSKGVRIDFLADPYWEEIWVSGGRYY